MSNASPDMLSKVRAIIQKRVPAKAVLLDDAPLYSSGLLDSLSIVDLITELEESFHISIPGAELQPDDLDSITKIANTVARFV